MMKTRWCHGFLGLLQNGGEMKLDEEADDPDDPPRPNTFLVSVIERMQVGRDVRVAEDTHVTQTHHSNFEIDLDDDIQVGSLTRADREPTTRTHYEMDTVNLEMLIQPRAPPQSQSAAPPSSLPRVPLLDLHLCLSHLLHNVIVHLKPRHLLVGQAVQNKEGRRRFHREDHRRNLDGQRRFLVPRKKKRTQGEDPLDIVDATTVDDSDVTPSPSEPSQR
ncbi:hypothetical protein Taro_048075 [Colocasia esculenta]|uniref:Uncharacterized protein n=1 Tax=Colocasia esculenta TaxID=4460 RepID=A0A843X267_COLES|nr:hypothetical protein [Colocasia esculenta]